MSTLEDLKEELGHYADYAAVKVADEYDRYVKCCAKVIFNWLRLHKPEDPQKLLWKVSDVAATKWLESISVFATHDFLKMDIEKAVLNCVETTDSVFRINPIGQMDYKK